jgi:hypothetical protein
LATKRRQRNIGEYAVVIAHKTIQVTESNPDASVTSFVYQKNSRLGGMQGRNGAIGREPHNILSTTEPHASVPRLQKEFSDRFSAVSGIGFELCAVKLRYTPFRSVDPDVPFEIAADRSDPSVW